jgi:hypothetical protein
MLNHSKSYFNCNEAKLKVIKNFPKIKKMTKKNEEDQRKMK